MSPTKASRHTRNLCSLVRWTWIAIGEVETAFGCIAAVANICPLILERLAGNQNKFNPFKKQKNIRKSWMETSPALLITSCTCESLSNTARGKTVRIRDYKNRRTAAHSPKSCKWTPYRPTYRQLSFQSMQTSSFRISSTTKQQTLTALNVLNLGGGETSGLAKNFPFSKFRKILRSHKAKKLEKQQRQGWQTSNNQLFCGWFWLVGCLVGWLRIGFWLVGWLRLGAGWLVVGGLVGWSGSVLLLLLLLLLQFVALVVCEGRLLDVGG